MEGEPGAEKERGWARNNRKREARGTERRGIYMLAGIWLHMQKLNIRRGKYEERREKGGRG